MKWDLDSHTSSRSLTHPAGNLNNKPAARNDHTAQPETEPALNRFALKPLALPTRRVLATSISSTPPSCSLLMSSLQIRTSYEANLSVDSSIDMNLVSGLS